MWPFIFIKFCRIYNKTMGTDSISDVCFPLDVFSNRGKKKSSFQEFSRGEAEACIRHSLGGCQPNLNSKDSIHGAGPTGCTGSLDDLLHGPHAGHILSTLWVMCPSQSKGELCWSPVVSVVWSLRSSRLHVSLYWVRIYERKYAM